MRLDAALEVVQALHFQGVQAIAEEEGCKRTHLGFVDFGLESLTIGREDVDSHFHSELLLLRVKSL